MEQARPLDLESGWEEIINEEGRQNRIAAHNAAFHAKRYQSKVDKLNKRAMTFGVTAMVMLVLWISGALVAWLSAPAALALAGVSCFTFGKLAGFNEQQRYRA